MNIFRDYFTREQLLASIVKAPYIPSRLAEYFTTIPMTSTVLALESVPDNGPAVMAATPRGTASKTETLQKAAAYTFVTDHRRYDAAVYADEVLNMRAVGLQLAAEIVQARRDALVAKLRNDVDYTHESMRLSCVVTPTNAFGTIPASQQIALSTDATKTRSEIFTKIRNPIRNALGGVPFRGIKALCSAGFWAKFIENAAVKATYLNTSMAQSLRGDTIEVVNFGGVEWEYYDGTGTIVVPTDEARVFPVGVQDMFIQGFAPADTFESVGMGAMGAPYILNAYASADNRRYHLEMQTNAVMVCTRPTAVLPITTN